MRERGDEKRRVSILELKPKDRVAFDHRIKTNRLSYKELCKKSCCSESCREGVV